MSSPSQPSYDKENLAEALNGFASDLEWNASHVYELTEKENWEEVLGHFLDARGTAQAGVDTAKEAIAEWEEYSKSHE